MSDVYGRVKALHPGRSAFNLSHEKKLTCDLGQLIPILCDEVVPGDVWKIGIEAVVRFMPMVAPVLHEMNFYVHYFFVPFRLMLDTWEDFITGGEDGTDVSTLPEWIPDHSDVVNGNGVTVKDNGVGSLWDYFGFPVTDAGIVPVGAYPLAWPRRAYNLVYNEFYRDENQVTEVDLDSDKVLQRAWEKDYFTSALPWQQKGVPPALPLAGHTHAVWPGSSASNLTNLQGEHGAVHLPDASTKTMLEMNTVDLTAGTIADVADLRLVFAIQRYMERNARAGSRYIEHLIAHYGVAPKDERLQRPEYIGGTKMPVMISEVLQTSSTDAESPQGNQAGHGIVAGRDFCASFRAEEFGVVIGIMSIMPRSAYHQGIPRQWLSYARATRYDHYAPEWANLSEQAVYQAELFADGVQNNNRAVYGYQGRFNEMRSKQSMVCGLMRPGVSGSLGFWNLSRDFSAAPALNETFITCIPRKDYLAAPTQPACIVSVANIIKAVRPIPEESVPGLLS